MIPTAHNWAVLLPPKGKQEQIPIALRAAIELREVGHQSFHPISHVSDFARLRARLRVHGIIGVGPDTVRDTLLLGLRRRIKRRVLIDPGGASHSRSGADGEGGSGGRRHPLRFYANAVLVSTSAAHFAALNANFPATKCMRIAPAITLAQSPWTNAKPRAPILAAVPLPLRRGADVDLVFDAIDQLRAAEQTHMRVGLCTVRELVSATQHKAQQRQLYRWLAPRGDLDSLHRGEERTIAIALGPPQTRAAVLEAMAAGQVIVAVEGIAGRELVEDEVTGLVVGETELGSALLRLARDPELCARLGEAALRRAREMAGASPAEGLAQLLDQVSASSSRISDLDAAKAAALGDPVARHILGVPVHDVTMEECIELVDRYLRENRPSQIATPNVNFLMRAAREPAFMQLLSRTRLNIPDGAWVVRAAWLLREPLRRTVQGRILAERILEAAAERGWRVFLLGAAPGVAERAAERSMERFPGLRIVGTRAPFFTPDEPSPEDEETVELIRQSGAQIVLVAFGMPKQDIWSARYLQRSGARVAIGIGGTFDILAGDLTPAPEWIVRIGMEFVWRVAQEPRRLLMRYLRDASVASEVAKHRISPEKQSRETAARHADPRLDRRG